jgi:hypothetical protein
MTGPSAPGSARGAKQGLRKNLFSVEDVCSRVSKDPRVIFVIYLT